MIAAAFALGGWPHESPASSPASTFSRAALDRIGDYIRNEIATNKIPSSILLIQQDSRPVYLEAFSVRDPETGQPMTADTISRSIRC
ncbi:hypothetical protein ACO2JO_07315 [Leptospira interrogans]